MSLLSRQNPRLTVCRYVTLTCNTQIGLTVYLQDSEVSVQAVKTLFDCFGNKNIIHLLKKVYGGLMTEKDGRFELRGHDGRRRVKGSMPLLTFLRFFTLTETSELEVKDANLAVAMGVEKVMYKYIYYGTKYMTCKNKQVLVLTFGVLFTPFENFFSQT